MIEKLEPGLVVIEGREYTSDVFILPPSKVGMEEKQAEEPKAMDRVVCPWNRKDENKVALADLSEAIPLWPDMIVIGTGFSDQLEVTKEVREVLPNRNINVIAFPSDKAYEAYSEMARSSNVAFALCIK